LLCRSRGGFERNHPGASPPPLLFSITNFVFWIGISHAGTLISAILHLVNATWRRPVTRCAEVITVFALMIGGMFRIIHLGRPLLFFWLIPYPNQRQILPNLCSRWRGTSLPFQRTRREAVFSFCFRSFRISRSCAIR